MDKRHRKIVIKSLNELKEAYSSDECQRIDTILNEIGQWSSTNEPVYRNGFYMFCDEKYKVESSFYSISGQKSIDGAELSIFISDTEDILVIYDYKVIFDDNVITTSTDRGDLVEPSGEYDETIEINEITLYRDGSDVCMIENASTYQTLIETILNKTTKR